MKRRGAKGRDETEVGEGRRVWMTAMWLGAVFAGRKKKVHCGCRSDRGPAPPPCELHLRAFSFFWVCFFASGFFLWSTCFFSCGLSSLRAARAAYV